LTVLTHVHHAGGTSHAWQTARNERRSSHRAVRRLTPLAAATPVLALALLAALRLWIDGVAKPDLGPFLRFDTPQIGSIYDSRGEVVVELAREYRRVVTYDEIPDVVREALLAAEDKRFFSHSGVDASAWPRILTRALRASLGSCQDIETGCELRLPQGGSTITQQLVRGFFLRAVTASENGTAPPPDIRGRVLAACIGSVQAKKLRRKLDEIRLALWLERQMTRLYGRRRAKEEIFTRYASFIYMGHGRYGLAAASEYYFGKPLSRVTAAHEAASLSAIPKSPRDYVPSHDNERARWRRDSILSLMVANGALPRDTARAFASLPVRVVPRPQAQTIAPAAVDMVFHELRALDREGVGVEPLLQGRISVRSTIDVRAQQIANEALDDGLSRYERRHPAVAGRTEGAVVVLRNSDAAVLAVVGGRSLYAGRRTRYSDFNRATSALRQPGSAMKPVVYLAALRAAFTLDSVIPDEPLAVPAGAGTVKAISNYDGRYLGPISLRAALALSRNAAAVWLARAVGMDGVLRSARSLGIRTPLRPHLSTALGASELPLIELAAAYRAVASGTLAEPYIVERITDPHGATLHLPLRRARPTPRDGLREIQEALRGVVRIPGGTAHVLDDRRFGIPVMGKTGTTSGFRDAVFAGSTFGPKGVTVAVWIGFDDARSLGDGETGAAVALPVFRDIVRRIYADHLFGPPPRFPREIEAGIDAYLARTLHSPCEEER
jgi:penicillin-binding protein 1A